MQELEIEQMASALLSFYFLPGSPILCRFEKQNLKKRVLFCYEYDKHLLAVGYDDVLCIRVCMNNRELAEGQPMIKCTI